MQIQRKSHPSYYSWVPNPQFVALTVSISRPYHVRIISVFHSGCTCHVCVISALHSGCPCHIHLSSVLSSATSVSHPCHDRPIISVSIVRIASGCEFGWNLVCCPPRIIIWWCLCRIRVYTYHKLGNGWVITSRIKIDAITCHNLGQSKFVKFVERSLVNCSRWHPFCNIMDFIPAQVLTLYICIVLPLLLPSVTLEPTTALRL